MGINSPAEIAKNYITIGKNKVNTPIDKMFLLAVSVFSTAASKCMLAFGDAFIKGNIVGGAICVGAVYWYFYLRKKS